MLDFIFYTIFSFLFFFFIFFIYQHLVCTPFLLETKFYIFRLLTEIYTYIFNFCITSKNADLFLYSLHKLKKYRWFAKFNRHFYKKKR